MSGIRGILAAVLNEYGAVPPKTPLSGDHPLVLRFKALQEVLESSVPVRQRPNLFAMYSVGKGGKTKVPWLALLDRRVTKSIRSGVYCAFLFRQDLSGFYLTLGLGATGGSDKFYDVGRRERQALREQAQRMAVGFRELANRGFSTDGAIDLRTDTPLGHGYEAATIAHRFYSAKVLPTDEALLSDLDQLLEAYDSFASAQGRLEVQPSMVVKPRHTTGKGEMAHPSHPDESLADLRAAMRRHRENLETRLLERIRAMPADRFEQFATYALRALGFVDMQTTRQTSDGGIDASGTFSLGVGRVRAAAQFKRWQANVGRPLIDQFRGALLGRYELGVFITTSDFARNVLEDAEGRVMPILLLNGRELVRRLMEAGTAVRTAETFEILELDDPWLDQFGAYPDAGDQATIEEAQTVLSGASGERQHHRARLRLADLVREGILEPSAALRIRTGGRDIQGQLVEPGRISVKGRMFDTPSAASKYATGLTATDGWVYWEYQVPATGAWVRLAEMRAYHTDPKGRSRAG